MNLTKLGEGVSINADDILADFSDNEDVSGWARNSVSKCVETGVMTGRDGDLIAPLDNITRAEAATIVYRLLIKSNLINK
jgi:hypothetical protein